MEKGWKGTGGEVACDGRGKVEKGSGTATGRWSRDLGKEKVVKESKGGGEETWGENGSGLGRMRRDMGVGRELVQSVCDSPWHPLTGMFSHT